MLMIITVLLCYILNANSEFYQNEVCKISRTHLSDRKVLMVDESIIQGSKVKFVPPRPGYSCGLRNVDEYRGLKYGEIKLSSKMFLRFFESRGTGRATETEKFATNFKPVCPQKRMADVLIGLPDKVKEKMVEIGKLTGLQSEECLWINVFVPEIEWNETEKLPVMIFIHGESYEVGTGNAYDGSVLSSYGGVIVITVNYRLGVLGFLSTGDTNAEGNYALWDLLAILFWVKQNIERFGGDAGRVTLFGHGHGAALVNYLLFTKSVTEMDALFHNVILQSGSAFSTWAKSIDPVRCAHLIARNVNCSHAVNNTKALVDCFREKSVDDLVKSVPLTPKYFTCFAPSIGLGGIFPSGNSLESLIEAKRSRFASTKIMFGLTRKEAYSYLSQDEIENGISEARKKQIIRTYVQNVYKYHRQKIYDILQHEYTQWDRPSDGFTRRDEVMDLLSDGQYKAPLIRMAQEHAKTADTYFYSFAYSTQSEDFPQWSGGVHGDELPYIFGAPLVGGLSPFPSMYTAQEVELSKFMMRMWTNFAKTGDPNLPEWDSADKERSNSIYFTGERWQKYNNTFQSYMHIGRKGSKVKEYFHAKEAALWLKLIPKLNTPDNISSEASHELDGADNMSTFDDPSRLISKFHSIFPSPPPPMFTPPFTPLQSDPSAETTPDDSYDATRGPPAYTPKPILLPDPEKVTPREVQVSQNKEVARADSSNVPLSVVIAIGCSLLFLNLVIFAAMYYQRRRIMKLRAGNVYAQAHAVNNASAMEVQETRNSKFSGGGASAGGGCGAGGMAETVLHANAVETKPQPKTAAINHKPISDSVPPAYTAISKPVVPNPQGPGGYTYSALSQASSSPMHTHNQTTSFVIPPKAPPSEGGGSLGSSRGSDVVHRPTPQNIAMDRTPKVDNSRAKHIARGEHPTSNNAITIV